MTRSSRFLPSHSAATTRPFRGQRWSRILLIACHLAEHRDSLRPALASWDRIAIQASLASSGVCAAAPADEASLLAAISLVATKGWLFGRWQRPLWRRIAAVLQGMNRRKSLAGLAMVAGLALVSVGAYFVRIHSYTYWQESVAPVAREAALVQQKAVITVRLATGVGVVPLGASVHAEGVLIEINKLNLTLAQLIVTSTDPEVLKSAYAEHPEARQVAEHDRVLVNLARHHLQLAREELDKANEVLLYAKKWHGISPVATLSDGLSRRWSSEVAALNDALNSGDIGKMEQADRQLENLRAGSKLAEKAGRIVGTLAPDDRAMAAPYLAVVDDAVARGELKKAGPALDALSNMQKLAPLSYSLYLLSIPGEKTFVVKQDAGNPALKHYYLIVQATNEHGAPVAVPVHDSQLNKDAEAGRFGVEVSADTFEQSRSQREKDDSLQLVGRKSAGTVATSFAIPVLQGRITHW